MNQTQIHTYQYFTLTEFTCLTIQLKVKAILVEAWTGLEDSKWFRLTDFKPIDT
jgi:hypothetical protein